MYIKTVINYLSPCRLNISFPTCCLFPFEIQVNIVACIFRNKTNKDKYSLTAGGYFGLLVSRKILLLLVM